MRSWRTKVGLVAFAAVAAACSSADDTEAHLPAPSASTIGTGRTSVPATSAAPTSAAPTSVDPPAASTTITSVDPGLRPMAEALTNEPDRTTAEPSTSTSAPFEATSVSFAFSGDILPHSPLWRGALRHAADAGRDGYDFDPMLAALAPLHASVDVAVCHLETPIAPLGEELSTVPFYGVPAEVIDAIAASGFDRCSTASNHTLDRGAAGIDRTVDEFERVGLAQSGMARTPDEILPVVFEVNGVTLSHLSYTFSYNGLNPPNGETWRSRLIDVDRIIADATEARAAGAEVVVVSLHWGEEKRTEPTGAQRDIAAALTASGVVDLIVGHHAHVVQPIEQVNGVWVVYGLGNILSNLPAGESFPVNSQDAMVVTIELHRDAQGEISWSRPIAYPTWVDKHDGWRVVVLDEELARHELSEGRRAVLEASRLRTASVVGDYGAGGDPSSAS